MKRPPARVVDSVTVKQLLSAEELRGATPCRFPELLCTQTANTEVHFEFISGERILTSNSTKVFSPQMLLVG